MDTPAASSSSDPTVNDERVQREKEFHNRVWADGTRDRIDEVYSIATASTEFYESMLERYGVGKDVLEYGCGPGSYAFFLAERGANVTGIDISETAIEQAEQEARRRGLSKLRFAVMNAEALDLPDASFDFVCGKGILHHLDLGHSYAEVARVMRPDGHAVFKEPLGHNLALRLFRAATPSLRTPDEHPLLAGDLQLARRYFDQVDFRFFHLLSLFAVPLRSLPGIQHAAGVLERADAAVFRTMPRLRKHAWQVVIELARPRPHS
jgi:SAM-dependent methyltransferase